jgi:uncharacterized membrane protein (DUF106 family)
MVDLSKHGTTITLLLLFLMMISYSIPVINQTVGAWMNVVLGPVVDPVDKGGLGVPFYIMILVLSALTGFYSTVIQKYTIDYERMTEGQKRMREFQKEYREAQLSQDDKKIKKLESRKDKLMAEQLEMSREQFKPMAYILVLSVPIFFWLLFRLNDPTLLREIALPLIGLRTLSQAALGPVPAWILWYFICSITISQIIRKAMNIGGI